jgi:septal ring-binding cell division protein DamX
MVINLFMRLFLIIIFVVASGVGLHFSGIISKFQESAISPAKERAIKPESIRNKVKEPVSIKPVYTFFKTLNDPTMTQYVDLKGGVIGEALTYEKIKIFPAKINVTPASIEAIEKISKLEPEIKPKYKQNPKKDTSVSSEIKTPNLYAVQVSSFRDEARARALKIRLKKNGFDAFLMQTELANESWYRVFLGRYADEQKAQDAAIRVKNNYKLNAIVVRKTD